MSKKKDCSMTVDELNHEQLVELKQHYLDERAERTGISWAETANADSIVSDEEVIHYYQGVTFVPEDFTCAEEPSGKKCPHCGAELLIETKLDYPYYCKGCDENFYGVEVE